MLTFQIGFIMNRPFQLNDISTIGSVDRPKELTKAILDGVLPSILTEKAELNSRNLQNCAVVVAIIANKSVANVCKGRKRLHGFRLSSLLFVQNCLFSSALCFLFSTLPDLLFFFFGNILGCKEPIFFLDSLLSILRGFIRILIRAENLRKGFALTSLRVQKLFIRGRSTICSAISKMTKHIDQIDIVWNCIHSHQ